MKKIIFSITLLLLVFLGFFASARVQIQENRDMQTDTFEVDGDEMTISVVFESMVDMLKYETFANEFLKKVSPTDEESEIYNINENGSGEVSYEVGKLLLSALELSEITYGKYDISVYLAEKIIREKAESETLMTEAESENILSKIAYEMVDINGTTVKLSSGMEIGLNGIVEGYIVNYIKEDLRKTNAEAAVVSFRRSNYVYDNREDSDPWEVEIPTPLGDDVIGTVKVKNKAVATSLVYDDYIISSNGAYIGSVIDPDTGKPSDSGLILATVISDDSIRSEALAKAFSSMGFKESVAFWQTYRDFDVIFMNESEQIYITQGLEDSFELSEDYADTEVKVILSTENILR